MDVDGRRRIRFGSAVGCHDGETEMGSTLIVEIGLNRESRDDLPGTFRGLRYRVPALPAKLGQYPVCGNFLVLAENLVHSDYRAIVE